MMFFPIYDEKTYTFENQLEGTLSTDIDFVDNDLSDKHWTTLIRYDKNNSNNYLQLRDLNSSLKVSIKNFWNKNHRNAIVEFDVGKSDEINGLNIYFYEGGENRIIWMQLYQKRIVTRESRSEWKIIKSGFLESNRFYHVKIVFNDQKNEFTCYIDGNNEGIFKFNVNSKKGVNYLQFETIESNDSEYSVYIDNIRYRWIPTNQIIITSIIFLFEVIFIITITLNLIVSRNNKKAKQKEITPKNENAKGKQK